MKVILIQLNLEVIDEENISNFDVEDKILFSIAPDIDLEDLIGVGLINNLEFLCVVSISLISIDIGAIDD